MPPLLSQPFSDERETARALLRDEGELSRVANFCHCAASRGAAPETLIDSPTARAMLRAQLALGRPLRPPWFREKPRSVVPGGGGWNGGEGGGNFGPRGRQGGRRRGGGGGGSGGGGGFENVGHFYESTYYPNGDPAAAVAANAAASSSAAAALVPSSSSSSPVSLRPAGPAAAFPCSKAASAASAASASAAAAAFKDKPVARNLNDEIAGVSSEEKKKEGFE